MDLFPKKVDNRIRRVVTLKFTPQEAENIAAYMQDYNLSLPETLHKCTTYIANEYIAMDGPARKRAEEEDIEELDMD